MGCRTDCRMGLGGTGGRRTYRNPSEIARKAIAFIIFEAIASEVGELINNGDRPEWTISLTDEELRDATEVLSQQAELSVDGVTNAEFAKAIEDGIETLREIYVVMD